MNNSRSRKLRIGVAGLGRIGWQFHCKSLGKHPDWQLVAVADPTEVRRREAEETYDCQIYARVEDMIEQAGLDAVTIATPTHLHKPHALFAFKHNLHVMLEKPMAGNLKDAQVIVRTASKAGRVLTVYQPHRAFGYFQHIKKIIDSGQIGQVYHLRRGMFRFVRRDDWQSLTKYGGGMLNNYGAHALDQLLALTGYDVKKVYCNLRRVASLGDAEDVVKIVYETREGVIGDIDINQATPVVPYEIEVYGTRGTITGTKHELTVRYLSPELLRPKKLNTSLASAAREYPSDDDAPFVTKIIHVTPKDDVDVYNDLARAIRTKQEPLARPEQALAVMRVIDRCRKESRKIVVTELK